MLEEDRTDNNKKEEKEKDIKTRELTVKIQEQALRRLPSRKDFERVHESTAISHGLVLVLVRVTKLFALA